MTRDGPADQSLTHSANRLIDSGSYITRVVGRPKSDAWKSTLKQKGWDDAYLGGDAFADFLKKETARVTEVLKSVGLVKS